MREATEGEGISDAWAAVDGAERAAAMLARVRAVLGVTQAELAARIGVARLTVIRWEQHSARPKAGHLHRLEEVVRETLVDRFERIVGEGKDYPSGLRSKGLDPAEQARVLAIAQTHAARVQGLGEFAARLAHVYVAGGSAILDAEGWKEILHISQRMLAGVPTVLSRGGRDRELYYGYDVGHAMEAAVHGLTYPEWITDEFQRKYACDFAEARLLVELELRQEVFETWLRTASRLSFGGAAVEKNREENRGSIRSRKRGRE